MWVMVVEPWPMEKKPVLVGTCGAVSSGAHFTAALEPCTTCIMCLVITPVNNSGIASWTENLSVPKPHSQRLTECWDTVWLMESHSCLRLT